MSDHSDNLFEIGYAKSIENGDVLRVEDSEIGSDLIQMERPNGKLNWFPAKWFAEPTEKEILMAQLS